MNSNRIMTWVLLMLMLSLQLVIISTVDVPMEDLKKRVDSVKEQTNEATQQLNKLEEILEEKKGQEGGEINHKDSPTFFQRVGQLFGKAKDSAQETKDKLQEEIPHEVKQGYEGAKEKGADMKSKVEEELSEAQKMIKENVESGKEKLKEKVGNIAQREENVKEWVQEKMNQGKEKMQDLGEAVREKGHQMKEKAKEFAEGVKGTAEGVKGTAEETLSPHNIKEKVINAKDTVKETAQSTISTIKDKIDERMNTQQQEGQKQDEKEKEKEKEGTTLGAIKGKFVEIFGGGSSTSEQQNVEGQIHNEMDTMERAKKDLVEKMKNLDQIMEGGEKKETTVLREIRHTLDQVKSDMNNRLGALHKLLSLCSSSGSSSGSTSTSTSTSGQSPSQTQSTFESVHESISRYMNELSHQMNTMTQQLQQKLAAPFQRWIHPKNKYFLQGCKYLPGLTFTYTNDNGEEVLDVTGEKADENSIDKLAILNDFRKEFHLPAANQSHMQNVSLYVHPLTQPRVLVKGTQIINDIEYKYQYDNGKETMNVTLSDTASQNSKRTIDDVKALNVFRSVFGISPREQFPQSTTFHHILKPQLKDEL